MAHVASRRKYRKRTPPQSSAAGLSNSGLPWACSQMKSRRVPVVSRQDAEFSAPSSGKRFNLRVSNETAIGYENHDLSALPLT